ncbi:MAG TPA: carboxylesterase family protein [Gemmatimonadaceae bacterium]|nr:carboxylesterase family protein [Gemmatimonadaceae bacterium]
MRPVINFALAAVLLGACAGQPSTSTTAQGPRINTLSGTLEGRVDAASGAQVFEGVPYAAPPVGNLRWRAPQAVASWQGVRSATRLGHNCLQHRPYGDIDATVAGTSEDCLYLNVWTPSTTGNLPVMVWIHGGGFFAGFGGEERHNPGPLVKKGAVVVTVNYRLGPMGFLAHPAIAAEATTQTSGNFGLLDQIAALQWVKRNIARFGGDPSRVMIFGESAGAMSVGELIGSPLAKGLFQRAVLESGTGTTLVQSRAAAESTGFRLATSLGVSGNDAATLARLRAIPGDSIIAAAVRMAPNAGSPMFWPVLDRYVLPVPVDSAIVQGRANLVPTIVGSNRDEPEVIFGGPARSLARLLSARGVPTYVYLFTRVAEDSVNRRAGAYHSAEITFVFGRPQPLQPSAGHTSYDARLADAMSDFWVAFARNADPNGPPAAGKWPTWPRYDAATDSYMELGPEIAPRAGFPRRTVLDSLDAVGRAQGQIRP